MNTELIVLALSLDFTYRALERGHAIQQCPQMADLGCEGGLRPFDPQGGIGERESVEAVTSGVVHVPSVAQATAEVYGNDLRSR